MSKDFCNLSSGSKIEQKDVPKSSKFERKRTENLALKSKER
jgi:hypothetical protein